MMDIQKHCLGAVQLDPPADGRTTTRRRRTGGHNNNDDDNTTTRRNQQHDERRHRGTPTLAATDRKEEVSVEPAATDHEPHRDAPGLGCSARTRQETS